jgi:hypothetical protein
MVQKGAPEHIFPGVNAQGREGHEWPELRRGDHVREYHWVQDLGGQIAKKRLVIFQTAFRV